MDNIIKRGIITKEPTWKKILRPILNAVEWGDHEYLLREFGSGLWRVWVTIYEPRWRFTRLREIFPWRLRLAIEVPVRQLVWSRCMRCGSAFTWSELRRRKASNLIFFQSGSVCHKDCDLKEVRNA